MLNKKDIENISKHFDAKREVIDFWKKEHKTTIHAIIRANIGKSLKESDFLKETKGLTDKNGIEFSEKFLKKIFEKVKGEKTQIEFQIRQYKAQILKMRSAKMANPIRFAQHVSEILGPDYENKIKNGWFQ